MRSGAVAVLDFPDLDLDEFRIGGGHHADISGEEGSSRSSQA